MNRPPLKKLFEEKLSIDMPLDQLSLDTIRQGFSTLFDRALLGVQKEGLDLDDVEMNRFLLCRATGKKEFKVPADSLSDLDRLKNSIIQNFRNHDRNSQVDDLYIVGLLVGVITDQPL